MEDAPKVVLHPRHFFLATYQIPFVRRYRHALARIQYEARHMRILLSRSFVRIDNHDPHIGVLH